MVGLRKEQGAAVRALVRQKLRYNKEAALRNRTDTCLPAKSEQEDRSTTARKTICFANSRNSLEYAWKSPLVLCTSFASRTVACEGVCMEAWSFEPSTCMKIWSLEPSHISQVHEARHEPKEGVGDIFPLFSLEVTSTQLYMLLEGNLCTG